MERQMTPLRLTALATSVRDVNPDDFTAFINFYTGGRPETIYVLIASFLEWKNIRVRSEVFPYAFAAKDWTLSYRAIAAKMYQEDDELVIKKIPTGALLFDAAFLIVYFDDAKEMTTNRALGLV